MLTVDVISRDLDIVSVAEIAEMLGVRGNTAWRWTKLSEYEFPDPAARLKIGPIWRRTDVERWAKRTGRLKKTT